MDTFLAWLEAHPALTQALAIIVGGGFALLAAGKAYKGVIEQIKATMVVAEISRKREQASIYSAFAADLDALKKSLTGFLGALNDDTATEQRGICKSVFLSGRHLVWESCAPKIGMLDPNHAANIIETYRFIDALTGRVGKLDLEIPAHRADIARCLDEATKQIEIVLKGLPIRPDRENAGPR